MDLLIGVVTALLGLGFIAAPWVLRVTSNSIASTTVVAGGVIVTLLGLQLARRAPRTPRGISSLAPAPPWHYASTALAIEFIADRTKVDRFLPDGLEPDGSGRCAIRMRGAMTYSVKTNSNSSSDCVFLQAAGMWKQWRRFTKL